MSVTTEKYIRVYEDSEKVFLELGPDADHPDCVCIRATDLKSKEWFGPVRFFASKEYMLALGNALIEASKP